MLTNVVYGDLARHRRPALAGMGRFAVIPAGSAARGVVMAPAVRTNAVLDSSAWSRPV